jgi:hypothetical protein
MTGRPLRPPGLQAASHWPRWLEQLSEGILLEPPPQELVETLRQHCQTLREPQITLQPVGQPCPRPAAAWHAERLCNTLNHASLQAQDRQARLAYHARWILRLSEPEDPRWQALVSVIIPVFNRADLVCEAIGSALAQTHPAVEVIVVDDGSSDDLVARLKAFGDRILLLRQPRQGVAQARNLGLAIARGDYINFLDSDDLLDPGWLAAAVEAFRAIADADLCYAAPRQKTPPPYLGWNGLSRYAPLNASQGCPSRELLPVVTRRTPFLMLGVTMARWLALRSGGFDTALFRNEDTDFWFRLGLENA